MFLSRVYPPPYSLTFPPGLLILPLRASFSSAAAASSPLSRYTCDSPHSIKGEKEEKEGRERGRKADEADGGREKKAQSSSTLAHSSLFEGRRENKKAKKKKAYGSGTYIYTSVEPVGAGSFIAAILFVAAIGAARAWKKGLCARVSLFTTQATTVAAAGSGIFITLLCYWDLTSEWRH